MVGLGRLELPTSPLSGVRSSQLSYRPGRAGARGPIGSLARDAGPLRPGERSSLEGFRGHS